MKGGDEMKQLLSGLFLFLIGILLFNMVDENKNIVFDSKNSLNLKASNKKKTNKPKYIKVNQEQATDELIEPELVETIAYTKNDVSTEVEQPIVQINKNNELENENNIEENNVQNTEIIDNLNNKIIETKTILEQSDNLETISSSVENLINEKNNNLSLLNNDIIAQIDELNENSLKIKNINDFMKQSVVTIDEANNKSSIEELKQNIINENIQSKIENINNVNLKTKYESDLSNIKKIVEDNNKPEVNIEDNQTYDHDLLLEIKDENDYQVYLNNNKITNLTISENGQYNLVIVDKALNEANINFSINKNEVNKDILEVKLDDENFSYPMKNYYVTQYFSGKNNHMGIDFGSYNKKEPIYPIAQGEVVYVGKDKYGANVVKIKHNLKNQQLFSTYAHMSEVYLTKNQIVTKDTLLGLMGSTGNSTGPHLHLEMTTCDWTYDCSYNTYKNSLVNPLDYF